MSEAERVFVGLGSNLQGPRAQISRALQALAAWPGVSVHAASRCYQSLPWGDAAQPLYVNAVAELRTALAPLNLLQVLLEIEARQGRVRNAENRYAARTLDLDLLLYGERVIESDILTLPHPRLHERAFVLLPLADIAADLRLPGGVSAGSLLRPEFASLCWPLPE